MMYIAVFLPEGRGYTVIFADMELATQGDTLEQAFANASEALTLYVEGALEDGDILPPPSLLPDARQKIAAWCLATGETLPADCLYQLIPAQPRTNRPVRINISLPAQVLESIDRRAQAVGMTRSGFIARAAAAYTPEAMA